jgi:hypothetical protein
MKAENSLRFHFFLVPLRLDLGFADVTAVLFVVLTLLGVWLLTLTASTAAGVFFLGLVLPTNPAIGVVGGFALDTVITILASLSSGEFGVASAEDAAAAGTTKAVGLFLPRCKIVATAGCAGGALGDHGAAASAFASLRCEVNF